MQLTDNAVSSAHNFVSASLNYIIPHLGEALHVAVATMKAAWRLLIPQFPFSLTVTLQVTTGYPDHLRHTHWSKLTMLRSEGLFQSCKGEISEH